MRIRTGGLIIIIIIIIIIMSINPNPPIVRARVSVLACVRDARVRAHLQPILIEDVSEATGQEKKRKKE